MADYRSTLTARKQFPRPPQAPPKSPAPRDTFDWIKATLMPFLTNVIRTVDDDTASVHTGVNDLTDKGADIESAAEIEITNRAHAITGTETIVRIDAQPGFRGWINLLAFDAWRLLKVPPPTGNIALSVFPIAGQLVPLFYDVVTELWYPISGNAFALKELCEIVETVGPYTETVLLIPEGIELYAVRSEVLEDITGGVTTYDLGHESKADMWGKDLDPTVNTTDWGPLEPQPGIIVGNERLTRYFWSNPAVFQQHEAIRLTYNGAPATGGRVRICIFYADFV